MDHRALGIAPRESVCVKPLSTGLVRARVPLRVETLNGPPVDVAAGRVFITAPLMATIARWFKLVETTTPEILKTEQIAPLNATADAVQWVQRKLGTAQEARVVIPVNAIATCIRPLNGEYPT
jgi:hypothetical protein